MEQSILPENEMGILKNFLKDKKVLNPNSFLQRIYVASKNGFLSHNFHSLCDGKKKVLVLIKAHGFYFGGYTSSCWNQSVSGCYVHSDLSFIFSLSNPYNKPSLFKCISPQNSIW